MSLRRPRVAGLAAFVAGVVLLAGCAGEGITGTFRAVGDTGFFQRPSPVERGWMVALPAGDDRSWELLAARPGAEWVPPYTRIEPEDVTALGGAWQPLLSGDRFELPIEPGDYLLCWVLPPDTGPATGVVLWCARLDIPADAHISATTGEVGFRAVID